MALTKKDMISFLVLKSGRAKSQHSRIRKNLESMSVKDVKKLYTRTKNLQAALMNLPKSRGRLRAKRSPSRSRSRSSSKSKSKPRPRRRSSSRTSILSKTLRRKGGQTFINELITKVCDDIDKSRPCFNVCPIQRVFDILFKVLHKLKLNSMLENVDITDPNLRKLIMEAVQEVNVAYDRSLVYSPSTGSEVPLAEAVSREDSPADQDTSPLIQSEDQPNDSDTKRDAATNTSEADTLPNGVRIINTKDRYKLLTKEEKAIINNAKRGRRPAPLGPIERWRNLTREEKDILSSHYTKGIQVY